MGNDILVVESMLNVVMKPPKAEQPSRLRDRIARLTEQVISTTENLFSKEAIERDRQFEEDIEREIANGAKFIPRKRKSR